MTHKDMNEDQLQRGGAQQFGVARMTYGEEIDGCWGVDFFNNSVGCGEMSSNRKHDPHYDTISFQQTKVWSCNRPPKFAGCRTRKDLGPALRRIQAFRAYSRFFEKSDVAAGFEPCENKLEFRADHTMNAKRGDPAYAHAFLTGRILPRSLKYGLEGLGKMVGDPPEIITKFTREFKEMMVGEHEENAPSFSRWNSSAGKEGRAAQREVFRKFLLETHVYDPAGVVQFNDLWADYSRYCEAKGVHPAARLKRNYTFVEIIATKKLLGDGMLTYSNKRRRCSAKQVMGISRNAPAGRPSLPIALIQAGPAPEMIRRSWDAEQRDLFPGGEDILMQCFCPHYATPWVEGPGLKFECLDELGRDMRGPVYKVCAGNIEVVAAICTLKLKAIVGPRCLVFGRLGECDYEVAGVLGRDVWHGLAVESVVVAPGDSAGSSSDTWSP